MKKTLAIILAIVMIAAAFAGCGKAASGNAVKIAVLVPNADHGWTGAVMSYAQEHAKEISAGGKYTVTVDRDVFVGNIKTFIETNIDKIIMNMLGTSSSYGLDALAKIAGYKDYADMRAQVLAQVTANLETINTSGLESSGTFTLNDNAVTLKSATDTMPGTIDNYGNITVTSPVNDPDAKKLLGSDTVTMEFKKV